MAVRGDNTQSSRGSVGGVSIELPRPALRLACRLAGTISSGETTAAAETLPHAPRPQWEEIMSHYVILVNFTEQGAKSIKDTVKRAEAFKAMAADSGVKVNSLLWTLGQHDVVATVEANDDIAATALSLSVASLGNVRTQTLKAFDAADMAKILGKMAV